MLAIGRDNRKVFLHEPRMGMAVPILVDLDDQSMDIAVPDTVELENDFARVNRLEEVKLSMPENSELIDEIVNFSRFYSLHFKTEIADGTITIKKLRDLIARHYLEHYRNTKRAKRGAGKLAAPQTLGALAAFER